MAPLPIIDLEKLSSTTELAHQLMDAGTRQGFFYVVNHGIPADLCQSVFTISRGFFLETPMEEKRMFWTGTGIGYTGMRDEALSGKGPGDVKESIYLRILRDDNQKLPSKLQQDRPTLVKFVRKCDEVTMRLLQGLAVGLNVSPTTVKFLRVSTLPEDFLTEHHRKGQSSLRLIHYPAIPHVENGNGEQDEDIRAGAHSDYGSITLLFRQAADKGGLQVLLRGEDSEEEKDGASSSSSSVSSRWVDVPSLEDAIVVNIGDALEFWTAGRLKSTVHRVVYPRNQNENVARLSIPFFVQPNPDTVLAPMISEDDTGLRQGFEKILKDKGYPSAQPVTAGEHLQRRYNATYGPR